jgi:hypothetical protein
MLPMGGMLIRVGNFVKSYFKCLNYKNMATTLGKPATKRYWSSSSAAL